jgi:hypothetical protein
LTTPRHAILALYLVLPHVRDAADSLLAQCRQQQAATLNAAKKKFAARTARQVECRPELCSGEMKKAPVYKTGLQEQAQMKKAPVYKTGLQEQAQMKKAPVYKTGLQEQAQMNAGCMARSSELVPGGCLKRRTRRAAASTVDEPARLGTQRFQARGANRVHGDPRHLAGFQASGRAGGRNATMVLLMYSYSRLLLTNRQERANRGRSNTRRFVPESRFMLY